jgi:acetyl esterase/lipase
MFFERGVISVADEALDAELAEFLEAFPTLDIWSDLPATRHLFESMTAEADAGRPALVGVMSDDHRIPTAAENDLLVRLYRPAESRQRLPALLWFHGGGYCLGSLQEDDHKARELVAAVGCAVLSVDYRLAPEHPFPAALDDAYAALAWLFVSADQLNIDGARIAVGGLSAGGGLAAGLALAARDRGEYRLLFQSLWCPMLDDRCITPSSIDLAESKIWSRNSNLLAWRAYLGDDGDASNTSPYAAPTRAKDLAGLPPVYMRVGSIDLFVDENTAYAKRLIEAGVATDFATIEGGFHAFESVAVDARISQRTRHGYYRALQAALFA